MKRLVLFALVAITTANFALPHAHPNPMDIKQLKKMAAFIIQESQRRDVSDLIFDLNTSGEKSELSGDQYNILISTLAEIIAQQALYYGRDKNICPAYTIARLPRNLELDVAEYLRHIARETKKKWGKAYKEGALNHPYFATQHNGDPWKTQQSKFLIKEFRELEDIRRNLRELNPLSMLPIIEIAEDE
jgi:hypothetical protein